MFCRSGDQIWLEHVVLSLRKTHRPRTYCYKYNDILFKQFLNCLIHITRHKILAGTQKGYKHTEQYVITKYAHWNYTKVQSG